MPPVIYNVPCGDQTNGKVELLAKPNFRHNYFDSVACFAGDNDELVAVGSEDKNIYIWLIPEDKGIRFIDSPLMSLRGHEEDILFVRYIVLNSTLASCGLETEIKLWSPFSLPDSK